MNRSCNKSFGGPLTTAHHKNTLETSLKMSGHQSALIKLIVFFSLCFPQVCISKTLNSGRQKRYTKDDICLESKKTLEKVSTCPTNDTAFKERSEKKNCNILSTCAGKPLVYHCVLSEGMIVEVCAPRTLITGWCCPFYNEKLGRVIEDYNTICSECPFQYTSDQCLNNSECVKIGNEYDLSEQTTSNNMEKNTPNVSLGDNNPKQGKEKNEETIVIALVSVTGISIIVLAITCVCCFRKCFTTVCDRSENNTDKQISIKPQINKLMVSGSSEPMIKKDDCATHRLACDF